MPDITGISGILKGSAALIKTIHDPKAKREAQLAAQKLANEHQIDLETIGLKRDEFEAEAAAKMQTQEFEATKAALGHRSFFVAGARPAMIWVGVISLFCSFVVLPLVGIWSQEAAEAASKMQMDSSALWPVISGTGIVAVARSHDKLKGVTGQ